MILKSAWLVFVLWLLSRFTGQLRVAADAELASLLVLGVLSPTVIKVLMDVEADVYVLIAASRMSSRIRLVRTAAVRLHR